MKKIYQYPFIFAVILLGMVLCIALAAKFPKSSIEFNSKKSAVYLYEKEDLFHELVKGQKLTTLDNYADSILLNIVYSLDSEKPLQSALLASYYKEDWQNADEAYYLTINEHLEPNLPYTRYWHGEMIFIKLLLMLMDIRGIRLLSAGVMLLLICLLGALLIKKEEKLLLGVFLMGLMITSAFIVPLCLEYISTFLVMLTACITVLLVAEKKEDKWLPIFLVSGMLTAFFDFLTTETLTCTMPLIMLLIVRQKRGLLKDFKSGFWLSLRTGILWASGYILTWVAKWGISSVVLKTNVFLDAFKQAEARTVGQASGGLIEQCGKAIFRNIALLLPFNFAKTYGEAMLLAFGVGFILFCIWFLYRKKQQEAWFLKLLLLIGLIPYIRYSVMSNHAYLHYFFTYRAQLVTVTVLGYAFFRSLDKNLFMKDMRWATGRSKK